MRSSVRLVLTLMLLALAARVGAYNVPYEAWMGAYVGDKKVGYLSFKIEKDDGGYRISSVMNNRLTILGSDLTQLVTTTVHTDSNYTPISEIFAMSSGGKTTTVRATFKKDTIECMVSAGSGTSSQSIPIPEGVSLIGDALFALPGEVPKVGHEHSMHYFNPLTLSIDKLRIKTEGRETITIGGKRYDCLVLDNITSMGGMKVWQEDDGEIVQVKAMMGITMIREDRRTAMSGVESGGADDFAVLTSLKPDKEIPKPREIKELDILLKGFDDPEMAICDRRQEITPVEGQPDWARVVVKSSTFDANKSISLPVDAEKYKNYLTATAYIDCDAGAIKERAAKIVGDEKNAYRACAAIRKWIYEQMKADSSIGITRSASDVLKSKVGVCRDYGILFSGLARAAGIPSKIAAGVLYTSGAFYYHVWVECFVGEWVPFDPTLETDFVDATHIKMAEGDATSMFGLAKVIGSLKAEVKDYK